MATSGTAAFDLDLVELIQEAGERAGYEIRSGNDMRTARRSLNLLLAGWANMGLNMWTFEQGSIALTEGDATYSLPADTVDLLDTVIRTGSGSTQSDITISRIPLPTYAAIPNKTTEGRPIQVLVTRTATPSITVWPVPDADNTYTFVYWRMRRLQDAGNGANTQDVPFRFIPALVAGLAYYLAMKVPGGSPMLAQLKQDYNETMQLAMDEDREKADVRFVPRIALW